MGKIFSVLLILAGFSCLHGQTSSKDGKALSKGSYSLAGSIQYTSSSMSDNYFSTNVGTLSITPQFTYFVVDHFSLGGFISYYNITPNISYGSFGPLLRYYFYVKDVNPFLEASFDVSIGEQYTNVGFGLKGGLEYFLSNSVAVEPSISYSYMTNSLSTNVNYPTTTITATVGIGINYFIF
jgi:opacity protein-like surface antigen